LAGAVVTIVVIFTLVPLLGYMGAALSTLICYVTMSAICYFYGQKYFPIPYQTGKMLFYLALAFGLSYGGFFLEVDQVVLQFLGRNILVLIFVLVVLLVEKEEFKKLLARKKPKEL
jgi:O-antigen/teichoic acid export membrane protein